MNNNHSDIAWDLGAALSLLHIMLFVVEILVMLIGVDFFLSVLIHLLLGHIGIVVLFYHCTHYDARGGCSDRGSTSGAFNILSNGETSWYDWFRGAALSFKLHIILFVVVFLAVAPLVVHFVYLLILLLLILVGFMVLLYHCTHYAFHGGHSDHSNNCGAFSVYVTVAASHAYWTDSAALSFRLSTHYAMCGSNSGLGSACGIFCVNASLNFSHASWCIGAALS